MAINITSFFGGMAKGAGRVLKENREQAREDKTTGEQRQWQIATEARQYALNKQQRLDIKAEQAEEYIGQLVAMGMDLNVAKEVAQGGKGAIEDAITNIQFGRENNVDTAGFYTLQTKGTVPITGTEISEISKQPSLVVDSEKISAMYGGVNSKVKNHDEAIMQLSNQQIKLNLDTPQGQAQYDKIEAKKLLYMKDINLIAQAQDTSGGDSRSFSESTVSRHIASHRNRHLGVYEAGIDLQTGISQGMKGDKLGINVADLKAVNSLRKGTKSLGDKFMNDEIASLETDTIANLQSYAAGLIRSDNFIYNNEYTSFEETVAAEKTRDVGDIITYRKDNNIIQVMWVGVPGNEYVPLGTIPLT